MRNLLTNVISRSASVSFFLEIMAKQIVLLFICVLCCFDAVSFAQWLVDDEDCRTPDKEVGVCVPIKQCRPIIELLQNTRRPIPKEVLNKVRSYTCGFEGISAKVCCPSDTIDNPTTTKEPGDISNHRNINLLPRNCGFIDSNDRILFGEDAGLNEFPWMALIAYRSNSRQPRFKCGATVINQQYILTAAHCITNLKESIHSVRVGEYDISRNEDCETYKDGSSVCRPPYAVQDLRVLEVIPHERFDLNTLTNDIGLLRVTPINFSTEYVKPICLPLGPEKTQEFRNAIVTGWGSTENGTTSSILQKVKLPIASLEDCRRAYGAISDNIPITNKQLCAGGAGRQDSCKGDSGGPLQVPAWVNQETRYVQHGIVSYGLSFCGLQGHPGVYTRVSQYMDWILDHIRR